MASPKSRKYSKSCVRYDIPDRIRCWSCLPQDVQLFFHNIFSSTNIHCPYSWLRLFSCWYRPHHCIAFIILNKLGKYYNIEKGCARDRCTLLAQLQLCRSLAKYLWHNVWSRAYNVEMVIYQPPPFLIIRTEKYIMKWKKIWLWINRKD